jgi:hypothetical protein
MPKHAGKLDGCLPRQLARGRHISAQRPMLVCDGFAVHSGRSGPIKTTSDNDRRGRVRALHHKLTAMRKRSNRPLVERLPAISIRDLVDKIPRDNPNAVYELDAFGLRYGGAKVLVSTHAIKVDHQQFRVRWVKTYFGGPRPLLVCACGRATYYLYNLHGQYSCRKCCRAHYVCQRQSKLGRKLLAAAKLRIKLGGLPNRLDTIAPKAPGKHHKQYYQARERIERLEMKARRSRLKPFDTRYFRYHV